MPAAPAIRFRALTGKPDWIDFKAVRDESLRYVEQFLQRLVDEVKGYPPPPPNSTYVRTGTLGRGWRVTVNRTREGINGYIINDATDTRGRRYMVYVQHNWQTALHRLTGWQRIDLAASAVRRRYRSDLQDIYRKHRTKGG